MIHSQHPGSQKKHSSEQIVDEILMTGLGPDHTHPYLVSLIDQELVIYKAFPFEQTKDPGHLSVRFSKVSEGREGGGSENEREGRGDGGKERGIKEGERERGREEVEGKREKVKEIRHFRIVHFFLLD